MVVVCSLCVAVAGFLNSFVPSSVREKSLDFVKREYAYLFKLKKKLKDFDEQMEKLKAAQTRVQSDVESANRDAMTVYEDVQNWLTLSNSKLDPQKMEEFSEAVKNVEVRCFLGLCPNLCSTRQLSKRVEKDQKDVEKLLEQYSKANHFQRLATRVLRAKLVDGFEWFDSRDGTFKAITEELEHPSVCRIGVHGMPGVGKTTLVRRIGDQAMEDCLFDEVAFVAITEIPNVRKIQGDIADALGLKLTAENEQGRAVEICGRLRNGQRILLILDNIWSELKLKEIIGISSQVDQTSGAHEMLHASGVSRCKLLMTSRNVHMLQVMRCTKNFEVGLLSSDESKALFLKTVGKIEPKYEPDAGVIISKCGCLPLAIDAVAKALLSNGIAGEHTWKDVRQILESSGGSKMDEVDEKLYKVMKVSYDMLKDKEAQQLFLLCGMHRQGNISIIELLRCSVALGLLSDAHTLIVSRNRVKRLVDKLIAVGLLLKGDRDEVKMHDLFRDLAISIAAENNMLVIHDEVKLASFVKEDKLIGITHISFEDERIQKLPNTLRCPQLKFLVLSNCHPSLRVPDDFFQMMTELKVLELAGLQELSTLPVSLEFLSNLQNLGLYRCSGIRDTSSISKLKQLDILSFHGSDIKELSEDMKHLTQLRVLDLSECRKLEVIPANTISSLARLEELYMGNSFSQWDVEDNASLSELNHLLSLKVLEIRILSVQKIPQELCFTNLTAFKIFIGDEWKWSTNFQNLKQLKVKMEKDAHLSGNIQQLLEITEDLNLSNSEGVRDFLNKLGSFQQLEKMKVKSDSVTQYLINLDDISCYEYFPCLKSLSLNGLSKLEEICHCLGEPGIEAAFRELKTLKVEHCESLKNLFPCSMVKYLLQLQEIEVNDCAGLVEIFGGEMVTDSNSMDFLKNVRSLKLLRLPKFVSFCQDATVPAQPLFNEKVQLPRLEELQVSLIGVKQIWQERNPSTVSSWLGNLTNLIVENCPNIEHLFSASVARSLEQLKLLSISGCESMKVIVGTEERDATDELNRRISFPRLDFLKLKGLRNLLTFCSGNCDLDFPSLKQLEIMMCYKFNCFSVMDVGSVEEPLFNKKVCLPNIETLTISHIKNKRILWDGGLGENAFSNLKMLKVKFCEDLKTLFDSNLVNNFKGLERLYVENCDSLETIFEFQVQQQQAITVPITKTQLKIVDFRFLPKLKHVWSMDPLGVAATFNELTGVLVSCCEELDYVFPASVAKGLPKLVTLVVHECKKVEEIVASMEEERSVSFNFPRSSALELSGLPKLKWFYQGKHTTNWSKLKILYAHDCGQMKIFGFSEEMRQPDAKGSISVSQPLFSSIKAISEVEDLSVEDVNMSKIIMSEWNLPMQHVSAITVFGTNHSQSDEVADLLPKFLQRFPNLDQLGLMHCAGVKHVPLEVVPNLKKLVLFNLVSLDGSWSLHSENVLEILDVYGCPCVTLSHQWASFRNLTSLYLRECDEMVHVFSPLTASSLVQLEELTIEGCGKLASVIWREEEGETSQGSSGRAITFNMLKILSLKDLPKLTCFSSTTVGVCYNLPALQTVTIKRCPNIERFCEGRVHTPALEDIDMLLVNSHGDEANAIRYWCTDINKTIAMFKVGDKINSITWF